jgi:DNA-binding protein H-NS
MKAYQRRYEVAKSYHQLVSQIEKLQARADRLKKVRAIAVSQVNGLISKFAIAADELLVGTKKPRKVRAKRKIKAASKRANGRVKRKTKVAPKYRGPGGLTWAGRGLMPIWLRQAVAKGKKKEDFLIKKAA